MTSMIFARGRCSQQGFSKIQLQAVLCMWHGTLHVAAVAKINIEEFELWVAFGKTKEVRGPHWPSMYPIIIC